jgi:hypothetical protein
MALLGDEGTKVSINVKDRVWLVANYVRMYTNDGRLYVKIYSNQPDDGDSVFSMDPLYRRMGKIIAKLIRL